MKKLKVIIASLLSVTALGALIAAAACDGSDKGPVTYDNVIEGTGISIEKTTSQYVLDGTLTTAVSLEDLRVKLIGESGEEGRLLDSSEYEVEVYKGRTKMEDAGALDGGSYNIWVKTKEKDPKECFTVVYVIDEVLSLEFNNSAEGTVTTQPKSVLDKISKTWSFTAMYKSGKLETVGADKMVINNFDTNTVTAAGMATAEYRRVNVLGEPEAVSATVPYTITASEASVKTYTYSFAKLLAQLAEEDRGKSTVPLKQEYLTGDNAFMHLEGNVNARPTTDSGVIDFKGAAFSVTFSGMGTLTIALRGAGTAEYGSIALRDEEGNYIAAKYNSPNVKADDEEYIYAATGSSYIALTFTIMNPGKYTVYSFDAITSGGEGVSSQKATRIDSVVMVDEQS